MKLAKKNNKVMIFTVLAVIISAPLVNAETKFRGEKFVVAIDAGHSKEKPGAISARGVKEYEFNRRFAEILLQELLNKGFGESFFINRDEEEISLNERAEIATRKGARVLLSVHHDSVQPVYLREWTYHGNKRLYSDKYRGFSLFYSEKNRMARESLLFAKLIGAELLKGGFYPSFHHAERIEGENRELVDKDRGVYKFDDLIILKAARMPAVLFECGIIVNRNEENDLRDPLKQRRMAQNIAQAIETYCKEERRRSLSNQ